MSLLDINNLSVCVDGYTLLDAIDLNASSGEVVSIIGPNGAGKTTLLRAISSDVPAASGTIDFAGRALADTPVRERARKLAVLTQHNPLAFAFTGLEVVALGRSPHSTGTVVDEQICREAMAALDVSHLAGRLYPSLSGGEQQRLQLARVLAQIWRAGDAGDRLLLLDEPVTSLDIAHQHQLMKAIRHFASGGAAVVMTVHDMTLAGAYSDRIVALKNGRRVVTGSPSEVLTAEQMQTVFETDVTVLHHPETGQPIILGR